MHLTLWRQLGIEKQIVIRGLRVEIGEALRKIPSFKVRKTPSGDRHIIKSNSASQTLGGRENTYWSRIESGERKRRFLNLRNVSFTGGRKGRGGLTCVHHKLTDALAECVLFFKLNILSSHHPLSFIVLVVHSLFCFFFCDSNGMIDL